MTKYKHGTLCATRLKIQHERFEKEKEEFIQRHKEEIVKREVVIIAQNKIIENYEKIKWYRKAWIAIKEAFGKKINLKELAK